MKRLIPASVLLTLIIVLCVIGNIRITKTVKEAKNSITECERLYSDNQYEKAQKAAEEFKKTWGKTSKSVSAYSSHCPLDDIRILAAILPEAVKHKNDFEFYSSVSQIKTALDTIESEQALTLESLY